jgi:cysteine desulfurase/selenocysteine lyase
MNQNEIRKDFPQLKQGFIYFDSGSTSLKPKPVLNAVNNYYETLSVSVGRGIYRSSKLATDAYNEAHEKVRKFFNGKGDIIFTKNCTEAINIIAHGIEWKKGDKIVTTYLEHNSNLLPWLNLRSQGVEVEVLKCKVDGTINLKELSKSIDSKTKLVAVTHASNVLGTILPVEDIVAISKTKDALVLIDGAQAAPHLQVDLEAIGCDFYAGSGHKMLGPSGTGFLYINTPLLNRLKPMMLGGGSATDVELENITYTRGRAVFEAGTPNIAGGIGLGAAVEYLEKIGMEQVRKHEIELTGYLIEQLKKFNRIKTYGPKDLKKRTGVVSFSIKDIPAHRIAILLDEIGGIAIRSGNHCAFLLCRDILKEECGTARVSFYIYNTVDEIDKFSDILKDVVKNV